MDLKQIKRLIEMVEEANISHFAIESDGTKIEVKKEFSAPVQAIAPVVSQVSHTVAAPAPVAPAAVEKSSDDGLLAIKAEMVGTFYAAPNPESPSFVQKGDRIQKGDPVCIIEAMKLFNEIESDVAGTIEKICVENGAPVEYGQTLFLVKA